MTKIKTIIQTTKIIKADKVRGVHGKKSLLAGSRRSLLRAGSKDLVTYDTVLAEWRAARSTDSWVWPSWWTLCIEDKVEDDEEEEEEEAFLDCPNGFLNRLHSFPSGPDFSASTAILDLPAGNSLHGGSRKMGFAGDSWKKSEKRDFVLC